MLRYQKDIWSRETVRLSEHLAIRIRKLAYAPKKLRKQQLRSCLKALRQCLILQR